MMKNLLLSAFLLLTVVSPPPIFSAQYYVSPSGNDSNPGTPASPWKTIQKAADTMTAGDTVYIKAGTYKERVIIETSGSAGNYITFSAYQNDTVTIDGSGRTLPNDWGGLVDISDCGYIKISGLRVFNAGPHDNNPGILMDVCHHIIIENNYTYNTTSSGIAAWDSNNIIIDGNQVELACNGGEQECISLGSVSIFEVKNNNVHRNGTPTNGGEGICIKDGSSNGKVFNNHVHHMNEKLGIYLDAWDKHTYNIEVYGNIIHDIDGNDCYTLAGEMGGLLENISVYNNIGYNADYLGLNISVNGPVANPPMRAITIVNNTFYNNGVSGWGGGIGVENSNIRGVVIRNNIVSQNRSFQISLESGVSMNNLTIDHNLIHGYRGYGGEVRGSDYVEGDPLFQNASGANFHLKENSPAINSGSSSGAPSKDYEGNSRPQGSGYDIGAYEYVETVVEEPEISLSQTQFNLTAVEGSSQTLTRSFDISNSGGGTLDWNVAENTGWLSAAPASGSGSGQVTLTIDPLGLQAGSYTGVVTVSSTSASNSPRTVTVNLTVSGSTVDQEPFGQFESPGGGSLVRSSIPVTGWALDDVSVAGVTIFRDPVAGEGSGLVYIGDAIMVEGARPDIETQYPNYPNNSRAGWGYMMLTNFLPNSGNGTFTIYAVVTDSSGQSVTLGSKSITCDNINAVKPFGALDTPVAGSTISGGSYRNWGWVLTPMPNSIPTDGSGIDVYVDSVNLGHPVYNLYRSDIAAYFPGYANSGGAVGYFDIDTAAFENRVHTIHWIARDNAGNTDGIGSRHITVYNPGGRVPEVEKTFYRRGEVKVDLAPVRVITSFGKETASRWVSPDSAGNLSIRTRELERLELHLPAGPRWTGYMEVGNHLRALPTGSAFDKQRGIFYWIPVPGFLGDYRLLFISKDPEGPPIQKKFIIKIGPKFPSPR